MTDHERALAFQRETYQRRVEQVETRRVLIELATYGSDPEVVRQVLDLDRRLAGAMDVRHLFDVIGTEHTIGRPAVNDAASS